MKRILLLFAIFLSLSAFSKAQDYGADVVWHRDTIGDSPFKYSFKDMWFSNDGKTLIVPQGTQLFLVDTENGQIKEKKEMGFKFVEKNVSKNYFLLTTDSTINIYNQSTYELIKTLKPVVKFDVNESFPVGYHIALNQFTSDEENILINYPILINDGSPGGKVYAKTGFLNINSGEFQIIRDKDYNGFGGFYSPDGRYYFSESFKFGSSYPNIFKSEDLTKTIWSAYDAINTEFSNYVFSTDSKKFYFTYAGENSNYCSIELDNNFKTDSININNQNLSPFIPFNDSLAYIFYKTSNSEPYPGILNLNTKKIIYRYPSFCWGGYCIVSPNKDFFIINGNSFEEIQRRNIPYDKLTKTEEEINIFNNGFTLAPNPTYDYIDIVGNFTNDYETPVTYEIFTSIGTKVSSFTSNNNISFRYETSNLNPGVYLMKALVNDQPMITKTFVVQR